MTSTKNKNCEICNILCRLDTHHIISKSKKGDNKKYNLINICPNCHRKIHTGDIIIEGKFMSTSGIIVLYHEKDQESITNFEPECFIF